ncbi:uncharacterized oxidoreductase YjmC-like isoform X2 [Diabrotica virgifera virgifera]|uniref:Malate dehydrogenase n=1 Tax=Diabrotica virgifera virgifera TaxID=50390 RepID=A0ABM5ILI0_DIAVI|nr:uncharacterized oxidoreductase YjmC-like isoform X2 [Diabrotica virgifera virgifera]
MSRISRNCSIVFIIVTNDRQLITPLKEARRFMVDCFKAVGSNQTHAEIVSDNLLEADYRGHYTHGMNRLETYINCLQHGLVSPNAVPTIDKETEATALVNGNNGFGAVVGQYCMNLAIEKAKNTGIGLVVCHASNHYGMAGMYALQAIKKGFIGFSATNSPCLMVPTRAKKSALGTNPMGFGVPAKDGDSFVLDMATTVAALGKIEIQRRKGKPIPPGWALNKEGKVETDADIAFQDKLLVPLGGEEINAGYKGYGLAVVVDVLSGILSGSNYGPKVPNFGTLENIGHAFIAINPKVFAPGVENRMSDLMNHLRNMEPVDPNLPVLVAGDPSRKNMEKVQKDGGLSYVQNQHDTNKKLAQSLNVSPMKSILIIGHT